MEAKDLMIGDWVFDEQMGIPVPVCSIREGRECLCRPIPLTPEVLEKNGWSHTKLHGSYGRKGMRIDGPPYEELPDGIKNALDFAQWSIDEEFQYNLLEIYMWRGNIRLWVNYVHELQRALRCCKLNELANNFKV